MKILVVVDMQNDFIDGVLGSPEAQAIVPNVIKKIAEYDKYKYPIIFTRDTHYRNYLQTQEGAKLPVEHCIYNTKGWNIREGLEIANCYYVDKETFGWPHWEQTISGIVPLVDIESIELVGLDSDICVISNALLLKAFFPEIPITVDASCCAGVTPESHKNAIEAMKMCQIDIINEN